MPYKDPVKERENARERTARYRQKHKERVKKLNWERSGIIFEDQFDNVYNDYIKQTNCECCYCEFTEDNKKSLDHDHNNTTSYNVRGIVCHQCNCRREDKPWKTNSGYRHIYYCKTWKQYRFEITFDQKVIVNRVVKNLKELIEIRDEFIKKNPWIYT